jgi:hypothetical protein
MQLYAAKQLKEDAEDEPRLEAASSEVPGQKQAPTNRELLIRY